MRGAAAWPTILALPYTPRRAENKQRGIEALTGAQRRNSLK
jgi:hypothetical protein